MLMCLPEGIVEVDASNLVFFLGLNFDFNNMSNVTYIYIYAVTTFKYTDL